MTGTLTAGLARSERAEAALDGGDLVRELGAVAHGPRLIQRQLGEQPLFRGRVVGQRRVSDSRAHVDAQAFPWGPHRSYVGGLLPRRAVDRGRAPCLRRAGTGLEE